MSKQKRLVLGLLLSGAISLIAYRRRSLSKSGVIGAITTGTATFGLGGLASGLSLIYFFVSSSLLSHYRERDKAQTATDKFSKGGQRDIVQVGANGGMATVIVLAQSFTTSPLLRETLQAGYVGALATATADTWATELGVLSTATPHLITTGKATSPGTSGGITPLGTLAAAGGAFSLGLVFRLLKRRISWTLPLIALLSGLVGSLFDSLLGATCQAMYYCPHCQKETERRIHSCGTPTQPLRGLPWMDNDLVNFLATLAGSILAILLHIALCLPTQRQSTHHLKATDK
jgi:uncharacterized protein (TIGR00297 family)